MDNDKTIIRPRPGRAAPSSDAADRTVIRPRPGGRRGDEAGAADATVVRPRRPLARDGLLLKEQPGFGRCALVDAAGTLLALATQLRQVPTELDVSALHQQAVQRVRAFQRDAEAASVPGDTIRKASYLLCSLVDETVLNTHWGEHSSWSQKSLLRTFHHETYGGERVFEMIEAALGEVRKDYDFLELAYLCLCLGFEGKFRIESNGRVRLEQVRNELFQSLREARDRFDKTLSPDAGAAAGAARPLHSFLLVWVLAAVLGLAGFSLYSMLLIDLNKRSDRLQAELAAVVPSPVVERVAPSRVRPEVVRLRELLAPEIERGVLTVDDYRTRVSVVLQAEELFGSGSTAIDESFYPVLDKIAKALEAIPGRVVVAGHTDSAAIRSTRYPSNWHLSLARASAVVKYMSAAAALSGRMLPEGKADTEPVADNATAEGRARNRRVTIDVFYVGE